MCVVVVQERHRRVGTALVESRGVRGHRSVALDHQYQTEDLSWTARLGAGQACKDPTRALPATTTRLSRTRLATHSKRLDETPLHLLLGEPQ